MQFQQELDGGSLSTISPSMDAEEEDDEEDDASGVFRLTSAPGDGGQLIGLPLTGGETAADDDPDHWKSTGGAGDVVDYSGATEVLSSSPAQSPPKQVHFGHPYYLARRNGAVHDDVKEKLISSGIIQSSGGGTGTDAAAPADEDLEESDQLGPFVHALQLGGEGRAADSAEGNSSATPRRESYRPGTPVQQNVPDHHGYPPEWADPWIRPSPVLFFFFFLFIYSGDFLSISKSLSVEVERFSCAPPPNLLSSLTQCTTWRSLKIFLFFRKNGFPF